MALISASTNPNDPGARTSSKIKEFSMRCRGGSLTPAWHGCVPAGVFNSLYSRGQSDSKEKGINPRCRVWPEKVPYDGIETLINKMS